MSTLSRLPLFRHNRSRFLYQLDFELLKHWANLQRALDGKAFSYVPTGDQRQNISVEQARIESMRGGLDSLTRIWQIEPKPGREIPRAARKSLIRKAQVESTRMLKDHKVASGSFQEVSDEEVMGLEDLLHYLDVKICLMRSIGEPCMRYRSLKSEIGYGLPQIEQAPAADS